ncbi:hypothetical protein [Parapedobacter tibetensis]|uniref:hypothetical protein n=1 Tax=Parapedobacter tibetensis TaxID=2972951 RepID=UPI00214D8285|nr:hypothetical protein [Parapedobacter tibetensis]
MKREEAVMDCSKTQATEPWPGVRIGKLIRRNLWLYIPTNLVFNTLVAYFNFEDPTAVYLFRGEQHFARFLLPMALLLPFIISFDILKKTIDMAEKEDVGFQLPQPFAKYRFITKIATVHTLMASVPIGLVLLLLPAERPYDGRVLAVILGFLAALLAAAFVWLSIKKLRGVVEVNKKP